MKPHSLDKPVVTLIAPRHSDEMNAFYFYRAASNWCQGVGYFKAAAFFAAESKDELEHAAKIEKYLVDWNITVPLPTVPKPQVEFSGLMEILEEAYKIEYNLYEAYEETLKKVYELDVCTFVFLQEFSAIQTKSVAEYSDKLNLLEGIDADDKFKLLLLEEKLF